MRRSLTWIFAVLVALAIGVGVTRLVGQRMAQQKAASQATVRSEAVVELVAADLVSVRQHTLSESLAVSGSLKATNSAFIKARVAGELQDLSLREGDLVRAGQVVARVDPTDAQARLRQAQQQAEAAKAQIDIAQRTYDNNRSLVEQGFISRSALDASTASLAGAQANFRAAQAGIDVISNQLKDTVLRAPITGLVSQRLAQNGERIGVDGRVLELLDISQLELEANLAAADSLKIRLGQTASLHVEGASTSLRAKVVRINPGVVAGSRSVIAYLALETTKGLRQGLFAQGMLRVGETQTLAIPLSAVRTDKPKPYIQIVRDKRIVHVAAELGAQGEADGQWMVALTGLAAGTPVVAGSVGRLREGTLVKMPVTPL